MDRRSLASVLFLAVLLAGLLHALNPRFGKETAAEPRVHHGFDCARELSNAFREAASTVQPAVVSIQAMRKRFGMAVPQMGSKLEEGEGRWRQANFGSGVLVRRGGYILTNNHVVKDAHALQIVLHDEQVRYAEIVGTDSRFDLAVLRMEDPGIEPPPFGDSDELQIGDWVLAVGNPFRLANSVTAGILSAKGRNNQGIARFEDFLQTDAAIHPGNSGGPLVNLDGEVIGLNTAISSRTGAGVGIGFAIPINLARQVVDRILSGGKANRGFLGVEIANLTEKQVHDHRLGSRQGVMVTAVSAGKPAQMAGLQVGDILLSIGDQPISRTTQLITTVAAIPPGTEVQLRFFRDGKTMEVPVVLATP
ncbi:MAG: PDZ domain-containing protein [Planctomycetota bacterium]|nr:MAG: PDZ domain-containing protein [Planctomycetota bacterium]